MIRASCISAVAMGMLAAANFVPAQDEKPKRPDAAALFSQLDKNGDGVITKEEFKAGIAKLRAATGGGAPAGGGPGVDGVLFRALDLNGDGKISAEEISRASESLKKLVNADGAITREGLIAAAA